MLCITSSPMQPSLRSFDQGTALGGLTLEWRFGGSSTVGSFLTLTWATPGVRRRYAADTFPCR